MDGEHPTSKALHARLMSFWWPDATVLYAGATDKSIGGRVAALLAHEVGDRQPHADGQWLHLLRGLDRLGLRIWWAETTAPEESLDAFFDAFGQGHVPLPTRPKGALALPWANTRRPTGERQVHGLTGSVAAAVAAAPEPPRRVTNVEPGDAEGARGEERGSGTTRRTQNASIRARAGEPGRAGTVTRQPAPSRAPSVARSGSGPRLKIPHGLAAEPVQLSQGALDRMTAELEELTHVKRQEVVARIKAAREHGDLKENAEYHAAREEQSFLEGRVLALEDRLRRAVVVVDDVVTGKVRVGSTVTVEIAGDEVTYTIVGSTEADPARGRLSMASPVGAALLGATAATRSTSEPRAAPCATRS
jgi:transcription elongation factor GreA